MRIYYIILLICLISSGIYAQENLTCADFKEGHFVIPANETTPYELQIIRQGNQQTEIRDIGGKVTEFVIDITWVDDCTYTLKLNQLQEKPDDPLTEEIYRTIVITTQMTHIEGNCADFTASASYKELEVVMYGKICKQELL